MQKPHTTLSHLTNDELLTQLLPQVHRLSCMERELAYRLHMAMSEPCQAPRPAPDSSKEVKVQSPLSTQVGGAHYKSMPIQPLEYCHANGIPKIEGDVIAYVSRWRNKGGIEDLRKSIHELEILIELETRKQKGAV